MLAIGILIITGIPLTIIFLGSRYLSGTVVGNLFEDMEFSISKYIMS